MVTGSRILPVPVGNPDTGIRAGLGENRTRRETMTPEREQIVRDTWKRFEPKAADHARYFYDKLFELDPETTTMFARANMDLQRHRLMESLGMLIA